jgi:hypothetical protein
MQLAKLCSAVQVIVDPVYPLIKWSNLSTMIAVK